MNAQNDNNFESLALTEIPYNIQGEEYVLVEASAKQARDWRANNLQAIQMVESRRGRRRETQSSFKSGIADSHILLVSLCLKKVNPDGSRSPVSEETVESWPNRIVESLFKKAQEISELAEDEDEDEDEREQKLKNEQKPLNLGSD